MQNTSYHTIGYPIDVLLFLWKCAVCFYIVCQRIDMVMLSLGTCDCYKSDLLDLTKGRLLFYILYLERIVLLAKREG